MPRGEVWETVAVPINAKAEAQTYIHKEKLTDDHARRFARLAIRDLQSYALVTDGKKWQVWAPMADEERVCDLIEKARDQ